MNYDKSTYNPGQFGWGDEFESLETKIKNERNKLDELANAHPAMMERKNTRQPNEMLIKLLKECLAKDGQVGGFRASYVEEVVFKAFLRWLPQIIGSCVASGGMRVAVWRMLIEIFLMNDPEKVFGKSLTGTDNIAPFAPYSYRAGRKFAGINGNGDGSYCSAHIRGFREYGMLLCNTPGLDSDAYPEPQRSSTYRKWGANNTLLEEFASFGKKILLTESEKITSASQSKEVINDGMKPAMVCSSWAFRPDYAHPTWRDRNGNPIWIYTRDRRTSWSHNMSIDGHVVIETDEEFTWVINSWGMSAHKNGHGFPIKTDEYDAWCRNSEQMSIGEIDMHDNPLPVEF